MTLLTLISVLGGRDFQSFVWNREMRQPGTNLRHDHLNKCSIGEYLASVTGETVDRRVVRDWCSDEAALLL